MSTATVRGKTPVQHVKTHSSRVVERFDPEEDFSDVNGTQGLLFALENEAPDRHYVWAYTNEDIAGFASGPLRYVIEKYAGDAPGTLCAAGYRGIGMLVEGAHIQVAGHTLMSCDREKWLKRQRFEATQTLEGNRKAMLMRGAKAGHREEYDQLGREMTYGGNVIAGQLPNYRTT